MRGRIKHYSGAKGYGFITVDGIDYFFMHTDFIEKKNGYCKVGNNVSFNPVNSIRGLRATEIRVI